MRLIAVLLLFGPGAAFADFAKCAATATSKAIACKTAAYSAKASADALASQYAQNLQSGLKQSADSEANVTQQITAIYASAMATCETSQAQCQADCSGQDSVIMNGCMKDVSQYQSQLSPGQVQTLLGNSGSLQTSSTATGNSSGGSGIASAGPTGNAGASALNGAGSASNPAFDHGANASNPAFNGGLPSGADGAGSAAGSAGSMTASEKMDQAAADSLKMSPEVLSQQVSRFCADKGNSMCPSCGEGSADLADSAYLEHACTSACMSDPGYGPQLGGACRAVISKKVQMEAGGSAKGRATAGSGQVAGGDYTGRARFSSSRTLNGIGRTIASGRSPAGEILGSTRRDLGSAFGPSIFLIHTRQIVQMCKEARLNCR